MTSTVTIDGITMHFENAELAAAVYNTAQAIVREGGGQTLRLTEPGDTGGTVANLFLISTATSVSARLRFREGVEPLPGLSANSTSLDARYDAVILDFSIE